MSWLAKIEIDEETVRANRISNDIYAWHKGLWKCFPGQPDAKRDFLTRIEQLEGAFRLWVLARQKPEKPGWCPPDCFALKSISESFLSHKRYAFDLIANPVKKVVQRIDGAPVMRANGKRKTGKRVPIVNPDELRIWLTRKGEVRGKDKSGCDVPGGFRIVADKPLEISPMVENHFRKGKDSGYHGGVQFRGVLEVTDSAHFTETYYSGIGSAKSFGFGLFLLAPINK
jgi:CRISPR system Cascade subunit CasE